MDKAEEIFAEGIEDRNVKTIRQARVLFVGAFEAAALPPTVTA